MRWNLETKSPTFANLAQKFLKRNITPNTESQFQFILESRTLFCYTNANKNNPFPLSTQSAAVQAKLRKLRDTKPPLRPITIWGLTNTLRTRGTY